MKIILQILLLISITTQVYCQDHNPGTFLIGSNFGISYYHILDRLLSYSSFKNNGVSTINPYLRYEKGNSIHILEFTYNKLRLKLKSGNNYDRYNYLDYKDYDIIYKYFHKLLRVSGNIDYFIGYSYNGQFPQYIHHYKNNLYDYSEFNRRSYAVSFANFSITTLLRFKYKKQTAYFDFGYSVVNFASRPSDDYIHGYT